MKKIYFLLVAVLMSGATFAQNDLTLTLDNYNDNDNTSADPLNLDFTITNNGGTIATGDSIFWSFLIGTTTYATDDLASGFVMFSVLQADMLNGDSFQVDAMDIAGSWLTTEFGASSGTMCAIAYGVGQASLSTVWDDNPLDNRECVNWSDASSFGELDLTQISAYPNPANDFINFQLGDNVIDQIQIMDISGRVIDVITVNGSNETVDVSAYGAGVYFYAIIKDDEAVLTEKFIVK